MRKQIKFIKISVDDNKPCTYTILKDRVIQHGQPDINPKHQLVSDFTLLKTEKRKVR